MDLNKLIKDLKKGNNIEKNLPAYANALAASYYNQAAYMLAMDLTSDYDLIHQEEDCDKPFISAALDMVMDVIDKLFVQKDMEALDAYVKDISDIRSRIVSKLDGFGDYIYYFQVYEYLFNRLEYKYQDKVPAINAVELADAVVNAIASVSDKQLMNEQFQSVLGELPIRMTNSKFFDLVRKGCMYYTGVRNDIADTFLDTVHKCVRPLDLSVLDASYKDLYALCEKLSKVSLNTLSSEEFESLYQSIADSGVFFADTVRVYVQLAGIVNDLLMLLLTVPYVTEYSKDMKKSQAVIREFVRSEKKGSFLTPDEDMVGLLRELTDRQRIYQGEHMMLEDALCVVVTDHKASIDSLLQRDIYTKLLHCMQMSSTAILAELSDTDNYYTVDAAYIDRKVSQMCEDFKTVFDAVDRPVKRSMMGLTITSLPVVFDQTREISAYIVQCFENCRDAAEAAACADMIRQIAGIN